MNHGPQQGSPTPTSTLGLRSGIKGRALGVSSQVLGTPSCQVSKTHHHLAPWPGWFQFSVFQAAPSLCGAKVKGKGRGHPLVK